MIAKASSNRGHAMVEGDPEGPELALVPARAEAEHEPTATDRVDARRHLRQHGGRMEAGAGHERPEPDATRDGGEPRQRGPDLRRAALGPVVLAVQQVVAEPDRVEAGALGGPGQGDVLRPRHVPLDLGQLEPHAQRSRHGRHCSGALPYARWTGRRRCSPEAVAAAPCGSRSPRRCSARRTATAAAAAPDGDGSIGQRPHGARVVPDRPGRRARAQLGAGGRGGEGLLWPLRIGALQPDGGRAATHRRASRRARRRAGRRPSYRQYVADAASWETIPDDGLPRHPGARPADGST
jgi:hypothetical protein